MALFEVDFPDDFLYELLDTPYDEIVKEALNEAAPILEASMKQTCRAVIIHEGDSELVDSIKSSKPKRTKTDAWIVNVGPRGYSNTKIIDVRNVPNVLKAIWKEYGVPGRQPPRPFITSACNKVRDSVMAKMQEVYNRKVGADES